MKRWIAPLLVCLLLTASLPYTATALHEDTKLHGEWVFLPGSRTTLTFHCSGGCDGEHLSMLATGVTHTGDPAALNADTVEVDSEADEPVTFEHRNMFTKSTELDNPGQIRGATVSVYLTSEAAGSQRIEVSLMLNGDTKVANGTTVLPSGQVSPTEHVVDLDFEAFQGPVDVSPGDRLTLQLQQVGSGPAWTLYLHHTGTPSHLDLTGDLLAARSWLEPPSGGHKDVWSIQAPETERRFRPSIALRPTLGKGVLYGFDPTNDGGNQRHFENRTGDSIPTDRNSIAPPVPSLTIDADARAHFMPTACSSPGLELDRDEEAGTPRYDVFRPVDDDNDPDTADPPIVCSFSDSSDLARPTPYDFAFDFQGPPMDADPDTDGGSVAGGTPLKCDTSTTCTRNMKISFVEDISIDFGLDDDNASKDVLPGETITYNLRAFNPLASTLTAQLSVDDPAPGWSARLSTEEFLLPPRDSRLLRMEVTTPQDATPGTVETTHINLTIQENPEAAPDPLRIDTRIAAEPDYDLDVEAVNPDLRTAVNTTATYFVNVTNTGNTEDTYRIDVQGLPPNITVQHRPTTRLGPGQRDSIRVTLDIPDDLAERFLRRPIPFEMVATSMTEGTTTGQADLTLLVESEFGFELEVLDALHRLRATTGTLSPDGSCAANDATAWGSWFRVTVRNTGGNPDTLTLNNVSDPSFWSTEGNEDKSDWAVAAYRSPTPAALDGAKKLDRVVLPAGRDTEFYLLLFRDHGEQTQCRSEDQGNPLQVDDGLQVQLTATSTNRIDIQESLHVTAQVLNGTLDACSDASQACPGVELEPRIPTARGIRRLPETPECAPRPNRACLVPGESTTLHFTVTNTGNDACVARDGDGNIVPDATYDVFFSRPLPGWDIDIDDTRLTRGLQGLNGSRTDGDPPVGQGAVTYNATTLSVDITVTGHAEANRTIRGALSIETRCNTPQTDDPDITASATVPLAFKIRSHTDFAVQAGERHAPVNPGSATLTTFAVRNEGSTRPALNLSLDATDLPGGWDARLAGPDTIQPAPFTTVQVPVEVAVPEGAPADQEHPLHLLVTGPGGRTTTATTRINTTAPGALRLDASPSIRSVAPGARTTYEATVTNTADRTVTIDNTGEPGDLRVTGLPPGWTAELRKAGARLTGTFTLDAGESADIAVRVRAPEDALTQSSAGWRLEAGTEEVAGTAVAALQTHVATSFGLSLEVDGSERAVEAGSTASYRLTVTNTGNGVDTVTLDAEAAPSTWTRTLGTDTLVLGPGEARAVPVRVGVPADAAAGTRARIQVVAQSQGDPDLTPSRELVTSVAVFGVDVRVETRDRAPVGPGEAVGVGLRVSNVGSADDLYRGFVDAAPQGWDVVFETGRLDVPANASRRVQVQVIPAATAAPGEVVVAFGFARTADDGTQDVVVVPVTVAPYLREDVDGDGIGEVAVDRDGDVGNGYEAFLDPAPGEGVTASAVVVVDGDGDGKPDFVIDATGDGLPDAYWSPVGEVLTRTRRLDVDGDGVRDALVDMTGNGSADGVVMGGRERLHPAYSSDIDGDGATEYLVDTSGEGVLDGYVDPGPGPVVRSRTALVGASEYAVDADGDGSHDRVVDVQGGTVRAFGPADAVMQLVTQYWWVVALLAGAIVLFGVIAVTEPKKRYLRPDREDEG